MKHAISTLQAALEVAQTNEPILRNEGRTEEADLRVEQIESFKKALAELTKQTGEDPRTEEIVVAPYQGYNPDASLWRVLPSLGGEFIVCRFDMKRQPYGESINGIACCDISFRIENYIRMVKRFAEERVIALPL